MHTSLMSYPSVCRPTFNVATSAKDLLLRSYSAHDKSVHLTHSMMHMPTSSVSCRITTKPDTAAQHSCSQRCEATVLCHQHSTVSQCAGQTVEQRAGCKTRLCSKYVYQSSSVDRCQHCIGNSRNRHRESHRSHTASICQECQLPQQDQAEKICLALTFDKDTCIFVLERMLTRCSQDVKKTKKRKRTLVTLHVE